MTRFALGLLLLTLASSAVAAQEAAEAVEPQAPAADEAGNDSASQEPAAATDATALEPLAEPPAGVTRLDLSESIGIALRDNFGLQTSADSVAAARLALGVQRAEFFPKVTPRFERSPYTTTLGASLGQALPWSGGTLRADFATRAPNEPDLAHDSELRVTLSQPLLRGFGPGASLYALRNARRAHQGQERNLALARQQLVVQVAAAFYEVVRQRQLETVARQSLERSTNLKKASDARMRVGMVSKLDVFRAELQEAQAREALLAAETGLETALESFRMLLGLPPRAPVEPENVRLESEVTLPVEPLSRLVERALAQRLEVAEGRDRVQDARRALAFAKQSLLPTLDVNVELSQYGAGSTLSDSLKALDRHVGVTLSAGLPIARAAERASCAIGSMNLRAAERSLREMELKVESEVLAAVRRLEQLRKSIALQRQGLTFAQQQQRLATLRYQRGLASNFDVVDAEGSLVASRTTLIGLLSDFAVARLQLERATGTLAPPGQEAP